MKASFKPSTKKIKEGREQAIRTAQTLNALEAVKMISLYVLRNQGCGAKRLMDFTEKFNEYATDISKGAMSLVDILNVIQEETGLTMDDLKIKESSNYGY